jgi:hypothetical protein
MSHPGVELRERQSRWGFKRDENLLRTKKRLSPI